MPRVFLRRTAAFCLALLLLLGAIPAYAVSMEEDEKKGVTSAGDSFSLLPESGYIQPGTSVLEWDAVENVNRYILTLDNTLTSRSPDLSFTTTQLSRAVNLSVSPEWNCTLTAELADGTARTVSAVYRTAVLYEGRILRAELPVRNIQLNLASTEGTAAALRFRWAEPQASLVFEDAGKLPSVKELIFEEEFPFTAAVEDGGFRVFADGAAPGRSYSSKVSVRLEGMEDALPAGTLTVRTTSVQPVLSVSAAALDLFTAENGAALKAASKNGNVAGLWIDEEADGSNPHPEWFRLDGETRMLYLTEEALRRAERGSVSLRLCARIEGYSAPVSAVCRVTLTDSAPALSLENGTVVLHPDGREPFTLRLSGLMQGDPSITGAAVVPPEDMTDKEWASYPLNSSFTAFYDGNGGLRVTPTDQPRNGKLLIQVWFAGSSHPVRLSLRVTLSQRRTLSLSASSLTMYRTSVPEADAVSLSCTVQPVNLGTGSLRVAELNGTREGPLVSLDCRTENGKLIFTPNENTAAGTLRLRIYSENADGCRALTVRVVDRMPALRCSVSGTLDLSDRERLLSLNCVLSNTGLTLEDAEDIRLSDPRLAVAGTDGNRILVRWLGGLTRGKQERCTLYAVFPGGLMLETEFTFTPVQSTVVFAFDREEITVAVGEQIRLPLTINRTGQTAVWSTDSDCVLVENGLLTASRTGYASVTASAGKYTDQISVWVVSSVTVPDGVYTLTSGDLALSASEQPAAKPADGSASQRWTLTHKGNGLFELRADDGRVLFCRDGRLGLRYPTGGTEECFRIGKTDGAVRVTPEGSELSVTLESGGVVSLGSGTLIPGQASVLRSITLRYTGISLLPGDSIRLSPSTDPAGM